MAFRGSSNKLWRRRKKAPGSKGKLFSSPVSLFLSWLSGPFEVVVLVLLVLPSGGPVSQIKGTIV